MNLGEVTTLPLHFENNNKVLWRTNSKSEQSDKYNTLKSFGNDPSRQTTKNTTQRVSLPGKLKYFGSLDHLC